MMIAHPHKVGRQLCLIAAFASLAATALASGEATIAVPRFLRDGRTDKICFEYTGTLRYVQSHYPSQKYGYIDIEPARFEKGRLRLKPKGNVVRQIDVRKVGGADSKRVRIIYQLDRWVEPTFHDSGSRLEIRFQPPEAKRPLVQPAIPPLDRSKADKTAESGASTFSDDIFAEYLKMDANSDATKAAPAPPKPSALPDQAPAKENPRVEAEQADTPAVLSRSQGGEGSPPAVASVATTPTLTAKPFVPEQVKPEAEKITGGRGYEFVDLTEEIFQKEVTMRFKDADLQNAIRILARQAGLNIVMAPKDVTGRLTIELTEVPVGAALASILRTNDLEMVREAGGIYRIVPARLVRREPRLEQITVHIPLNWVSAADVKKILDPVIDGDVAADTIGNSVIITDTPLKIEEIANVIRRMDKPEKQVMLETRLVEMSTELARGLGIQWDLARLDRDVANRALGLPKSIQHQISEIPGIPIVVGYDPVSGTPILWTPPGTPVMQEVPQSYTNPLSYDIRNGQAYDSLGIIEPALVTHGLAWAFGRKVSIFGQQFQLSAFLQAAEEANLAKVLAAPRVVTVNNQPAKISITRKIPYATTVVGAGGAQAITYNYEDVGIDLTITPNITNNDYVRMKVQPSQKILIGQRGEARPTIDERISETNVIVKDEDTAVIAGLRQQEFSQAGSGVPWFSKIPILGWAFKSKTYNTRKTDLMAFITPHIIKEGQILSEQEQFRYNEIDVQWDLPDYFFDDVKFDLNEK